MSFNKEANQIRMDLLKYTSDELKTNQSNVKINGISQCDFEKTFSENFVINLPTITIFSNVNRKVSFKNLTKLKENNKENKLSYEMKNSKSNIYLDKNKLKSKQNNRTYRSVSSIIHKSSVFNERELALISLRYLRNISHNLKNYFNLNYTFQMGLSDLQFNYNDSNHESQNSSFDSESDKELILQPKSEYNFIIELQKCLSQLNNLNKRPIIGN